MSTVPHRQYNTVHMTQVINKKNVKRKKEKNKEINSIHTTVLNDPILHMILAVGHVCELLHSV